MSTDSQRSAVLSLMDTFTRHVDGANQQSLMPA
jgi:methyl-accepting chemotaxis protein